jgi:hypothetical protein
MRPMILTRTATGQSNVAVMDTNRNPFNVGIGVSVSGTVNYTIQHTFDDVNNTAVTPVWFNHPSLAALSANADGNYAFPVAAIRINVNSGSGTATARVIQAGLRGG